MRDHPEQHNVEASPGGRIGQLLRDMLGRAERGELRCVAVAAVCTDDSVGTAWADNGDPRVFTLVGALEEIQRRLLEPPEPDDD